MRKNDALNTMKNSNINEKVDCYNFLLNVKLRDRTTNYERNRKRILNTAKNIKITNK